MSVQIKGKPISQASTKELSTQLERATGKSKVNIINELTKRGIK